MDRHCTLSPDAIGLSTLLDFGKVHCHAWRPFELRDMVNHQWAAPLRVSVGPFSDEVVRLLREASPPLDPSMSLGDLLRGTDPPLALLRLVKRFAKTCRGDANNSLPREL